MARVLLGITGGIAAFKSSSLLRLLRKEGHEVRCALTRAASQFVSPLTLEILSEAPVFQEQYLRATGARDASARGMGGGEELHITASKWADVVCVAPATTHTLVRLAYGFADDFLTTTLSAYGGPVVLAPAMHTEMWNKRTTQEAVARLREQGAHLVGPVKGVLANGEIGEGRMVEPELIARSIRKALTAQDYAGKRVVVTAGPTFEPLDPVRFLGNRSSGRMGFAIADAAALRGASVHLIAGPCALSTPGGLESTESTESLERVNVTSTSELEAALEKSAPQADLVVMCAAVADFTPASPQPNKIKREGKGDLEVKLVANPDLLAGLAEIAPDAVRVGFAAETENLAKNAARKLLSKRAHYLCANDVSRSDIGFDAEDNELSVHQDNGDVIQLAKAPKSELGHKLLDIFLSRLREDTPGRSRGSGRRGGTK